MPMVPSYNGNIPMAGNEGYSGGTASGVMPAGDPDGMLAKASQTGAAVADNLGALFQIQRGWEVKAASTDADSKAMELINSELMDPEKGYFTMQGKNAIDGFKPCMDRLKKGMDDIAAGVPDYVRVQVKEKLDDRLASAISRAGQFRFNQTREYMASSLQAHMAALTDDYATHFADKEYGARTLASMWENVQQQARMKGFNEEQTDQLGRGFFDAAESKRYGAWAQVDPQAALADFQQSSSSISPDIRARLEGQLYSAAKGLIVNSMVQAGGLDEFQGKQLSAGILPAGSRTFGGELPKRLLPGLKAEVVTARGTRNNNPLNIRLGSDNWVGQVKGGDSEFVRFSSPEAGIRAAAKVLRTYGKNYGLDTVEGIISRWAPATENPTPEYIKFVCEKTGFKPGEKLNLADKGTIKTLLTAMMEKEIGGVAYPPDVIDTGINAAFGGALPAAGAAIPAGAGGAVPAASDSPGDVAAGSALRTKVTGPAASSGGSLGKWGIDPTIMTGNPIVDALPLNQKLEVMQSVVSLRKSQAAASRSNLNQETANSLATYADTGKDDNALTLDMFVQCYGQAEGVDKYEDYRRKAQLNVALHDMGGLDAAAMATTLEALKPSPGDPHYAEKSKAYSAAAKAAGQVMSGRVKDPVGAMVSMGLGGFAPLDAKNPEALASQLRSRADSLEENSRRLGVACSNILTAGEAKALVGILDNAPIDTRAAYLTAAADSLDARGVALLSGQLKGANKNYAVALSAMTRGEPGAGMSTGEKYLRGVDAVQQKRVKIDAAAETGIIALLNSAFGDDPEEDVAGMFDNPAALSASVELARGVAAYNQLAGGGFDIEGAAREAAGGDVVAWNSRKIVLPRGVSESAWFGKDFGDALDVEAGKIAKAGGDFLAGGYSLKPSELSRKLRELSLKTESTGDDGSVTYSILYNGQPVFSGKDRKLYTFTIGAAGE